MRLGPSRASIQYATHKRRSKSWASRNLSLICYSFLYCLFVCVVALHGRSCDLLGKILVVVLSSSRVPHPCLYEDGDNLFTMSLVGLLKASDCFHTFYFVWNAVPAFCNSN